MKVLLTGVAGFIGMHTAKRLLERGDEIIGVDNLNAYYSVDLKSARLRELERFPKFQFHKVELADCAQTQSLFEAWEPQQVIHLAAQPGVRYSLENPRAYVDSNLVAFVNILEGCRHNKVAHLLYASSSSVYGGNKKVPFAVSDNVDHPVSLYAATKKANELMAYTYSHLFRLPTTGLRFFTVYGPWGRPDMAPFLFTRAILEDKPIQVFNHGDMKRDFTYIDDIVEGVVRAFDRPPPGSMDDPPYKLYNIGNNQPIDLLHFIEVIEKCLGRTATKQMFPMQPGDVVATWADTSDLERDTGFSPQTPIETGVGRFIEWYKSFYCGVRT